tara:strand:+ start:11043 stop:11939 length:897 start_codon:yes stop_codon:yes gene_type:complete
MATLNEIAYNIKNLAYGGSATTSEESVGIRQIKFWIHYYRAMLIKEESISGRGVNTHFLQEVLLGSLKDFNFKNKTWADYVTEQVEDPLEFIIFSERTINLSGTDSEVVYNEDYYGRDFKNQHTFEEGGDYGLAIINLPNLLHVDGYGIKNLRVRRNHNSIDLPIVSINEWRNKKYNRFTSKSPAASILISGNEDKLIVGNLKSVYREAAGNYDTPIRYRFYADALYSNPTDNDSWINDDTKYPIPDVLISELNRRILTQEMGVVMQSKEDTIDDERDSTNVQQAVQGQVPNRQRRTR